MIASTKTAEIRNIEFINGSVMFVHLSNERTFLVPLNKFPALQKLTDDQRKDFEIIDGTNLSFLALDEIFSLSELTGF